MEITKSCCYFTKMVPFSLKWVILGDLGTFLHPWREALIWARNSLSKSLLLDVLLMPKWNIAISPWNCKILVFHVGFTFRVKKHENCGITGVWNKNPGFFIRNHPTGRAGRRPISESLFAGPFLPKYLNYLCFIRFSWGSRCIIWNISGSKSAHPPLCTR